jgi:hypothetical protein
MAASQIFYLMSRALCPSATADTCLSCDLSCEAQLSEAGSPTVEGGNPKTLQFRAQGGISRNRSYLIDNYK